MRWLVGFLLLCGSAPAARAVQAPAPVGARAGQPAVPVPPPALVPGSYPLRRVVLAAPDAATAAAQGWVGAALEPVPLALTAVPPGERDPAWISKQPLGGVLPIGKAGSFVRIAFDESGGAGSGYDRLFADRDLNGRLAGETPVAGRLQKAGSFWFVDFTGVELPAAYVGGAIPVTVRIHGYRLEGSPWRFSYVLSEFRMGTVQTDRGPVEIVLADTSMRADYDQRCAYHSAAPTGDGRGPQVWISPDPLAPGSREPLHLSLGTAQLLGRQLYRFEPSASGDAIRIEPYAGAAGRARVAGANARREALPVTEVTLLGVAGRYELSDSPEPSLPEGDYYSVAEVRQADRDGDWTLRFMSQAAFRLPAAKDTPVPIGGPLHVVIAPRVPRLAARRGDRVTVKILFLSEAGYELVGLERPGPQSGVASVVLRSPAGAVVARSGSGFA